MFCFLKYTQLTNALSYSFCLPVIRHIQNMLLRTNSDFLQDPLSCMLADVVARHYPLALVGVSTRSYLLKNTALASG